jgi:putative spermidine/putrescine transport system substrate-binding protein
MSKRPLKVIGTSVTLPEQLRRRALRDLAFPIEFDVLDGISCQQRGITSPGSFDVYDQWFHSIDLLWTAGSVQPIETRRIRRWNEVSLHSGPVARPDHDEFGSNRSKFINVIDSHMLARDTREKPASTFSHPALAATTPLAMGSSGMRPSDLLFVQEDNTLGPAPTPSIAMLPTTYNVDSFAYAPGIAAPLGFATPESWAWLLDERWHGRCTLSKDPAASTVELALAARSAGLVEIADPCNLSIEEIDALFDLLMARRRTGHFSRFWSSSEDSIRLMSGPTSVLGSLWSPAFYALRGMGHNLAYAAPREGYRGWQSGLGLSAALTPEKMEMAYAYLNWWLEGVAGAIMARQGYYISVVEPVKKTLSAAEWDYWYGGLPASEDLPGLATPVAVRAGERREGGSYTERVSRVAVWSTIMPEHNYLVRRWQEFLKIRG